MRTFVFIPNLMRGSFVEVGERIGSTICVLCVVLLYKSAYTRNRLQLLPLSHFNNGCFLKFTRILCNCPTYEILCTDFFQCQSYVYTLTDEYILFNSQSNNWFHIIQVSTVLFFKIFIFNVQQCCIFCRIRQMVFTFHHVTLCANCILRSVYFSHIIHQIYRKKHPFVWQLDPKRVVL